MSQALTIDIIIVNYNSGSALSKCLSTIGIHRPEGSRLWLIDNDSNDDSLMALSATDQDPIRIIKNQSNVGFARACNQGAAMGKAPVIAIINPDCFITGLQLANLAETLHDHADAALIGCRVLNEDGSLQKASRRRLPTFWRVLFELSRLSRWRIFPGININGSGYFNHVQKVEAVNGACVLFKRKAFQRVGGFDEAYPLHFEDLDLFHRIQQEGNILYDSSVEVVHLKGHSTQDTKQIKAWKRVGLIRYFQKHRPRWEAAVVKFLLAAK